MNSKKIKNQKGITLVALVITIIVLLILAGVTINMTLGERGIFSTAQKAAENYKTAQEKEFASLNSFENEMDDTIYRINNRMSTKITSANYGDKVNYSANGETDWKIFYNDGANVYLILSGYLPYSKVPAGAEMSPYEGRPYTANWASVPEMQSTTNYGLFRPQIEGVTTTYSLNSGYNNSKCVSTLANTSNWTDFVNTSYADFAIGAPTLEMWIASWNTKGYTKLYCDIPNAMGYYVGLDDSLSSYCQLNGSLGYGDKLYFPMTSGNDENGYCYWLASPCAWNQDTMMLVSYSGMVGNSSFFLGGPGMSARPVVRLKSTTTGEKVNGVWELK